MSDSRRWSHLIKARHARLGESIARCGVRLACGSEAQPGEWVRTHLPPCPPCQGAARVGHQWSGWSKPESLLASQGKWMVYRAYEHQGHGTSAIVNLPIAARDRLVEWVLLSNGSPGLVSGQRVLHGGRARAGVVLHLPHRLHGHRFLIRVLPLTAPQAPAQQPPITSGPAAAISIPGAPGGFPRIPPGAARIPDVKPPARSSVDREGPG